LIKRERFRKFAQFPKTQRGTSALKSLGVAVLFFVMAGMGCQTTIKTASPAGSVAQPVAPADKRVEVEADVAHAVHVFGVHPDKGPDGYLRVKIDVRNASNAAQHFVYRIDWFDQSDAPLPVPAPRVPWSLRAGETASLFAVAPSTMAKTFRITFSSLSN
jgi:hypothetical protein